MESELLSFSKEALLLNETVEIDRIVKKLRETVLQQFRRQGAVVGISGGVDSAVVLALCARAFGPERVLGVMMPERESSAESVRLAKAQADQLSVRSLIEDITPLLVGSGCYQRRDDAVRCSIPNFDLGWQLKIVLPQDLLELGSLNIFHLIVHDPLGEEYRHRLTLQEFRQIVAASNIKQRARMLMLYYHAELNNFAVIGTGNKNEHDLGFFVKYGDGGADINPIGHLFKTQVYQLARKLDVSVEIQKRTPTTDTYPGAGSQEEFFYRLPFVLLDTIWHGHELGIPVEQIANAVELEADQVERVIKDIVSKMRTTEYLRTCVEEIRTGE